MKNDGFTSLHYNFGDDEALNERVSTILNEACHVFHMHSDGNGKTLYKPRCTKLIAREINAKPSLIRKLLNLNDPVVSNITYAAIELNKREGPLNTQLGAASGKGSRPK